PGYFAAVGIPPIAGRTFAADEDTTAGGHPVAMLSERLWRRRFNSDPALVNHAIRINDAALTIVGIMPDGFNGVTGRADLWIPATMAPRLTYSDYLTTPQHFISVVARLKRGVTSDVADAELATITSQLADDGAAVGTKWSATVVPVGKARIDPT